MAGIRIGGTTIIPECSPPFGIQRTSDDSFNVYRACTGNAAGEATQYSDFSDGDTVIGNIHNVRLSPDGRQILFQLLSETTGLEEIWVVDNTPGSTATQLLADGSDSFYHPSWGPDSDTFVYVQGTGAGLPTGGTIFKDQVSAIGSPVTLKTAAAGFSVYRPQFNFDGTLVAYWSQQNVGAGDTLRVMNDDGTGDATVDTGVGNYDSNNPQTFGWARGSNMIAYDAGANAYVINSDGTGRVAINANGPAAGANFNITADCWAMDDSFVVVTADLFGDPELIRAELDGSNTSRLNVSHTMPDQTWFRGAFVFNSRIWFVESVGGGGEIQKVASTLQDGTDYRVDLDVSAGSALAGFFGGDGFVWD